MLILNKRHAYFLEKNEIYLLSNMPKKYAYLEQKICLFSR